MQDRCILFSFSRAGETLAVRVDGLGAAHGAAGWRGQPAGGHAEGTPY